VSRIVLDGGGCAELLEEEPPLDPPLDPPDEDEELGGGQGCTAIVCVSVPCGTTTEFEPGGIFELPDWVTAASEHAGTAMVRSLCCFGITTVRTPGFISAVDTASICELDDLLPHAARPSAATAARIAPEMRTPLRLIKLFSPP
jgi:hypothetical protein